MWSAFYRGIDSTKPLSSSYAEVRDSFLLLTRVALQLYKRASLTYLTDCKWFCTRSMRIGRLVARLALIRSIFRPNTPYFGAHSPKRHHGRFFRLKKVRRDCAQSPDGRIVCAFCPDFVLFLRLRQKVGTYIASIIAGASSVRLVLERMQSRLNAIQRHSIHGEFRCFKHWIFHIKSIPERIGGLSVPNV